MVGVVIFTGSEDRVPKRLFYSFKDGDHDNVVTMKTRSNHQTHINPLFCYKDTKTLAKIHCSIQEISYKTPILVKIWL